MSPHKVSTSQKPVVTQGRVRVAAEEGGGRGGGSGLVATGGVGLCRTRGPGYCVGQAPSGGGSPGLHPGFSRAAQQLPRVYAPDPALPLPPAAPWVVRGCSPASPQLLPRMNIRKRGVFPRSPPRPPLCDIPSGCWYYTGPWTVTRSSLRMLRRVATFCRPLRLVLLLVSFPRSRSPAVGVPGLCWMWRDVPFACQRPPIIGVLRMCWLLPGSFDCFCCPHTSVHRPSIACLAVFLCGPGALFLHALSGPSTTCPPPPTTNYELQKSDGPKMVHGQCSSSLPLPVQ